MQAHGAHIMESALDNDERDCPMLWQDGRTLEEARSRSSRRICRLRPHLNYLQKPMQVIFLLTDAFLFCIVDTGSAMYRYPGNCNIDVNAL